MPNTDLNRKLRLEKKLFSSMRHIFLDMVEESVKPIFIPQNFLPTIASSLSNHYKLVSDSFANNYRDKHINVIMDEMQESLFTLDLKEKLEIRAFKQSRIIIDTSVRQFKRINGIIVKNNLPSNTKIRKNLYRSMLSGRLEAIACTETQWTAEFSKFLEIGYLTGTAGMSFKTAPRPAKRWDTMLDSAVRIHHAEAEGQLQFLSDPFMVNGESLMYPGDVSLGATSSNIVNCRCGTTYDLSKKDLLGTRFEPDDVIDLVGEEILPSVILPRSSLLGNVTIFKVSKAVGRGRIIGAIIKARLKRFGIGAVITPFDDVISFLLGQAINIAIDNRRKILNKLKQIAAGPQTVTIGERTNKINQLKIRLSLISKQLAKDRKVSKLIKERLAKREALLKEFHKITTTKKIEDVAEEIAKLEFTDGPSNFTINFDRLFKMLEDPELFAQVRFLLERRNSPGNIFKKMLSVLQLAGVIDTEVRRKVKFLFFSKKDTLAKLQKTFDILEELTKNKTAANVAAKARELRKKLEGLPFNLSKLITFLEDPDNYRQLKLIFSKDNSPKNQFKKILGLLQLGGFITKEFRREIKFIFFSKKDSIRKLKRTFIILSKLQKKAEKATRRPRTIVKSNIASKKMREFDLDDFDGKYPGGFGPSDKAMSTQDFTIWLKKKFPDLTSKQRNLINKMRKLTASQANDLITGLELIASAGKSFGKVKVKKPKVKKPPSKPKHDIIHKVPNAKGEISHGIISVQQYKSLQQYKGGNEVLTLLSFQRRRHGINFSRHFGDISIVEDALTSDQRLFYKKFEGDMNAVFNKTFVEKPFTVHRMIFDKDNVNARTLEALKIGDSVPVTSFQSTSPSLREVLKLKVTLVRNDIMRTTSGIQSERSFDRAINFTINVPRGAKAIHIDKILDEVSATTPFGSMKEIVLPNEGAMKIKKMFRDKNNELTVEFDFIPPKKVPSPIRAKAAPATKGEIEAVRTWLEGLDHSEDMIRRQIARGQGSKDFTRFLSSVEDSELDELENNLRSAMRKSELKKPELVHRVIIDHDGSLRKRFDRLDFDDNVPVVNFQATSKNEGMVRDHANDILGRSSENDLIRSRKDLIWFRIKVPKGTRAIDINEFAVKYDLGPDPYMQELLLPDEGLMNITKKFIRSDGGLEVELTFIPKAIAKKAKPTRKVLHEDVSPVKERKQSLKVTKGEVNSLVKWFKADGTGQELVLRQRARSQDISFVKTLNNITGKNLDDLEQDLQAIMRKTQLKEGEEVYRVIVDRDGSLIKRIGNLDIGEHIPASNFQSTSKSFGFVQDHSAVILEVAEKQAGRKFGQSDLVWFEINVPKGLHAIDVEDVFKTAGRDINFVDYASEVILPNTGRMKIIKKTVNEDGGTVIKLDFIPAKIPAKVPEGTSIIKKKSFTERIKEKKTPVVDADVIRSFTKDEISFLERYRQIASTESLVPNMQQRRFGIGRDLDAIKDDAEKAEVVFNKIFKKARINKDMKLYQSVFDPDEIMFDAAQGLKPGDIIPTISIQSTTSSKLTIKFFNNVIVKDPWTYIYNAPAGSNVIAIDRILIGRGVPTRFSDEFLVNEKAKLRIVKIDRKNKTMEFDILPDDTILKTKKRQISKKPFIDQTLASEDDIPDIKTKIVKIKKEIKPQTDFSRFSNEDHDLMQVWKQGGEDMMDVGFLQRERFGIIDREFGRITEETFLPAARLEKDFRKLFEKAELTQDVKLYRVVADSDDAIENAMKKLKVGDDVPLISFQSTTTSLEEVQDFAEMLQASGHQWIFEINAPRGAKVLQIDDVLNASSKNTMDQLEYVMSDSGKLRIKRIDLKERVIEFDLIPDIIEGKMETYDTEVKTNKTQSVTINMEIIRKNMVTPSEFHAMMIAGGFQEIADEMLEIEIIVDDDSFKRNVMTEAEFHAMLTAGGFNEIADGMVNSIDILRA
jgi:hypothetical protein